MSKRASHKAFEAEERPDAETTKPPHGELTYTGKRAAAQTVVEELERRRRKGTR